MLCTYAALNGEINIFSIEPAFRVESEKLKVESTAQNTKQGEFPLGEGGLRGIDPSIDITIYDIYGRKISNYNCHPEQSEGSVVTINISNLQNGIYFIKAGSEVAKFIKE